MSLLDLVSNRDPTKVLSSENGRLQSCDYNQLQKKGVMQDTPMHLGYSKLKGKRSKLTLLSPLKKNPSEKTKIVKKK